MPDGEIDYYGSGGRLPGFAKAGDALARALPTLAPPERIAVSEAARRYRRLDVANYRGPWRNDVGPYMVEPMDMTASRRYGAVVFAGPARSLKTDALILNTIVHRVKCMPRNMRVVHINQDSAREFTLEKLNPMIRACPEIAARLGTGKGSDNIFDKRFAGGMRLSIGWPVIGKLSASDLPDVLFTDYDRQPENVDGEGDPFTLGRKRNQTFGSLGMTVVESSPGRPILVEGWRRSTPHEAPPATGITSLYNRGTRGWFYWTCPECQELFCPTMETLSYDKSLPPAEAAASTVMVCPVNGCVIDPAQKPRLNAAGFWLHEASDGSLVRIADNPRPTDIVSYWLFGPAAAFQSWRQLVQRELEAREHFERTGDEQPLKSTVNVDQGLAYLPRAQTEAGILGEEILKALAEPYAMGIAPAGTRFITVQVDVQAGRFVVQVEAWGVDLERWLIDRFDIHEPPPEAPGAAKRTIDPARYQEDWAALRPLLDRRYPVAGTGYSLMPCALIVDSAGAPGVTDQAYAFYRASRAAGLARRVHLVKGAPGLNRDRAVERTPERSRLGARKGRVQVRGVRYIQAGVDLLKDEVAAALTRKDDGPGSYHLPESLPATAIAEFCAERRLPTGWERKAGATRNESLDLAAYGRALVIILGGERIDWERPPAWAAPMPENVYAVLESAPEAIVPAAQRPASRMRRILSRGVI